VSHFRSLLAKHPLRVALLVTIVVAIVATSAFAFWLSPPHKSGPKASTVSQPLEFTIELDKTEFQQGEDVTVRLSLRNISNETITVAWPNYHIYEGMVMYFNFNVLDENGTVVYAWKMNYGYAQAFITRPLEPNEEITNAYPWHQLTDLALGSGQVPEGSYSVRGLSRLFELTVGNQKTKMTLETPTIAFTIT